MINHGKSLFKETHAQSKGPTVDFLDFWMLAARSFPHLVFFARMLFGANRTICDFLCG